MKCELFSSGGENAKVVTGVLISMLLSKEFSATVTHDGGVLASMPNKYLMLSPDGTITLGDYEG